MKEWALDYHDVPCSTGPLEARKTTKGEALGESPKPRPFDDP